MGFGKYHSGKGYAFYCYRDTDVEDKKDEKYTLREHRLLMFAWGEIDSVFFENDCREIHHFDNPKWLNIERNLEALTPYEHMEKDENRAKIHTPWNHLDRQAASD